jgi:hypothetical protein
MMGRWGAITLAAGVAVAIALAAVLPGEVREPERSRAKAQRPAGKSYRDHARRFTVEIPAGWRRARRIVIPQVTNPREILVVSTFSLDSSGEPCGPFYDHLIDHMGPRDGLVAVVERSGHAVAGPPQFRPRPRHFRLPLRKPEPRGCGLARDRTLVRDWWIPFHDAGRDFYGEVAIGLRAPEAVRRDARRLLDSLRFQRRPRRR